MVWLEQSKVSNEEETKSFNKHVIPVSVVSGGLEHETLQQNIANYDDPVQYLQNLSTIQLKSVLYMAQVLIRHQLYWNNYVP